MGYGDEVMATGMARGAHARGKRIAFGDGHRIIWGPWSEEVFANNPNIARPGSERAADIEWVHYYKGRREYNKLSHDGDRWIWNMDFRPTPGEFFFSKEESELAARLDGGFILIDPNVPYWKPVAVNKQWPIARFQAVADGLLKDGHRVVQLCYDKTKEYLANVELIGTRSYREAMAAMSRAKFFIGHEGGMHHGAAALGVKGVVIFGGFIPPEVTGYPHLHVNLTGGASACGRLTKCDHCARSLDAITVEMVLVATRAIAL